MRVLEGGGKIRNDWGVKEYLGICERADGDFSLERSAQVGKKAKHWGHRGRLRSMGEE